MNAGSLAGRADVLRLGLAAVDGQTQRAPVYNSAFYNTQGRKIQVGNIAAPVSWLGSLYIPSSWSTPSASDGSGSRRSDMWATLWPASGGDTCAGAGCDVFPIVGFSNAAFPDHDNNPGGTPRYRVFDGANGGWINLATPVVFDDWTDFCVTFTGTAVEYRIGGQLVYTAASLAQSDTSFGPVTQLADVSVQAYNYGYDYDANWSRLAAGSGSCAALQALFTPPTATASATASDTASPSVTATPTSTDTAPPSATPTDTPPPTATSTDTPPATATSTDVPTATATPTPLCPSAPRGDCPSPRRSLLVLRRGASSANDRLIWRWARGDAGSVGDFADPTQGAGYALCIYSGSSPTLVLAADLSGGPPWVGMRGHGYRYDPRSNPNGIERAQLHVGRAGRSRAFVRGRGDDLPDAPLGGLSAPITAQLLSPSGGACLGDTFGSTAVLRNDASRFKARTRR